MCINNRIDMKHFQIKRLNNTNGDLRRLINLLRNLNDLFIPPLNSFLNIDTYTQKLLLLAEVFVAEINNQDVGVVAVYANDNQLQRAFLSCIGVQQNFHNRGIGSSLLDAAVRAVMEKGMMQMRLEVCTQNSQLIEMYKKKGFSEIDPFRTHSYQDSIFMELIF